MSAYLSRITSLDNQPWPHSTIIFLNPSGSDGADHIYSCLKRRWGEGCISQKTSFTKALLATWPHDWIQDGHWTQAEPVSSVFCQRDQERRSLFFYSHKLQWGYKCGAAGCVAHFGIKSNRSEQSWEMKRGTGPSWNCIPEPNLLVWSHPLDFAS